MSESPAGWYPQPDGRQRYWDGQVWTESFAPAAAADPVPSPAEAHRGAMTTWEYCSVAIRRMADAQRDLNPYGAQGWELVSFEANMAVLKRKTGG